MSKFTRVLLVAGLLTGSATAASASINSAADDQSSLRTATPAVQLAQFNSAPSQSSAAFDRRLESFGGY
jgi:hypothetical protein